MHADGGNPTQLTTEGENAAPSWSPHGKNLAFGSDRTGRFEIWVMHADGSNRKQLWDCPPRTNCDDPVWSAGGGYILYSTNRTSKLGT